MALSVNRLGKGVKVQDTIPKTVAVRLSTSTHTVNAVLVGLEHPLHLTAERIFTALFHTALQTAQAKGQPLTASQVTIHQPAEVLAAYVGVSIPTLYKYLHQLRTLGLVAHRGHVGSYYNLHRKTGTLFAVSLKPGHRAKVRYEDLRHQHRNLTEDIEGKRTAWTFLQSFKGQKAPTSGVKLDHLVAWAVNPGQFAKTPVSSDSKTPLDETVYSLELLSDTHPSKRGELVDRYAKALARGFLDSANVNFWRKLLWNAVKREHEGQSVFYQLQNALTRLMADVQEWAGLKKPGALLVHRLKQAGIWDALTSP